MTCSPLSSALVRDRSRNFRGGGSACDMGGVGCCVVAGAGEDVSGVATRAWRERHVLMMFPKAVCVERDGGEAGGEATRAAWRRVVGGRGGSHWSAEGNNIVSIAIAVHRLSSGLSYSCIRRAVGWRLRLRRGGSFAIEIRQFAREPRRRADGRNDRAWVRNNQSRAFRGVYGVNMPPICTIATSSKRIGDEGAGVVRGSVWRCKWEEEKGGGDGGR